MLVDELDGHRPLADPGGDPLDRPAADVAGREDAGHVRLEQERLPGEGPPGHPAVAARARAGPVTMKPARSRSTMPASHSVRGSAPMKRKSASIGSAARVPAAESSTVIASRPSVPRTAATLAFRRISTFGSARSWSTR